VKSSCQPYFTRIKLMVILVVWISIVISFVLTPGYHSYHSYLNCTQTLERCPMDSGDKGTQGIPLWERQFLYVAVRHSTFIYVSQSKALVTGKVLVETFMETEWLVTGGEYREVCYWRKCLKRDVEGSVCRTSFHLFPWTQYTNHFFLLFQL
jgi:hypothetical protein